MKAIVLNCTLKASPERSNTGALAAVVADALRSDGVVVDEVRLADHAIPPGVESDLGEGDEWPGIRARILDAEILVFASPTWLGRPSSIAQRALERMDAMISEEDDEGQPVAYNRVAGVVVTGNEDGAHHVISEIAGALIDIGYTWRPASRRRGSAYTAAAVADHLRIVLPSEIADELVEEGVAVRPLGTRGGPLGETASLVIETINTGSALVSIAVSIATCKRLAATAMQRRRPSDPDELKISATVDGESRSLSVDRTAPNAEDEVLDFFVAVLDAG